MFTNPKLRSAELLAVAAVHESLTTPDSEDWTVVPYGDRVALTAMREKRDARGRPEVAVHAGMTPVAEIKKIVEALPENHDLGCVTVIMLSDGEKFGAIDLLCWLTKKAREKHFSAISIHGPATTREAIKVWKSRLDAPCDGRA